MASNPRRLAVLIDGDFVEPQFLGDVMGEAGRHGKVAIRRVYGNAEKISHWKECLKRHRIEIIPNYAAGRNAADNTLIIDAVEMFRSRKRIDGFCIVASDNHFAGLANWIRTKEAFVVGIGSRDKPPLRFKKECNVFKHVEELPPSDNPDPASQRDLTEWKGRVRNAISRSAPEGGWARLSVVQAHLPEIDPRVYCHKKLLSLIGSCPEFQAQKSGWVRLRP